MITKAKPLVITRSTYSQILRLLLFDKARKKSFDKLKADEIVDTVDVEAIHVIVVNDTVLQIAN